MLAAGSDITLLIDGAGVIRDLAVGSEDISASFGGKPSWIDRPWAETVYDACRPKIAEIMNDARSSHAIRRRHLNQKLPDGRPLPILWSAVRLDARDRIVAYGRDLRPISALQQKLVHAQQSMQREFGRLRLAEQRYRQLFHDSDEATLLVDAATEKVVESNLAADRMIAVRGTRGSARPLSEIFEPGSRDALRALLGRVVAGTRLSQITVRLADGRDAAVSAVPMRQDGVTIVVLRIRETQAGLAGRTVVLESGRGRLFEAVTDALVTTDGDGQIVDANPAFVEMAQLASEEQVRGQPLGRWLGREGVELALLLDSVRERGPIRLYATTVRGEHGANAPVEVSAVPLTDGAQALCGFVIRDVGPRLAAEPRGGRTERALPRSVEQLSQLIGHVPLKELVREATDVIERLAIEAALELTRDNRASAAEMLGLSRQSLYVKLRRFGLGDLSPGNGEST